MDGVDPILPRLPTPTPAPIGPAIGARRVGREGASGGDGRSSSRRRRAPLRGAEDAVRIDVAGVADGPEEPADAPQGRRPRIDLDA